MSDIQVTSVDGSQINVSTGAVIGPLPSLQLAAGDGITITSGGGVSTISANLSELLADVTANATAGQLLSYNGTSWAATTVSVPANLADLADVTANATAGQALTWNGASWAAESVPPGTTVNGLSGSIGLLGGSGVTVQDDGQNLTISASGIATEESGPVGYAATNLRVVRNSFGELNFEWDSPLGYTGQYSVEVIEVGISANVTSSPPPAVNADGSLSAGVTVDNASIESAILFAANGSVSVNNQTVFYPTISGDLTVTGNTATISGAFLPGEFTDAGPVHLMTVAYDAAGLPVGRSEPATLTVSQHGSPVAPEILGVSVGNGTIDLSLFSRQTPHQRGFFDFDQLAYFAEINENASAQSGWVRGDGVVADLSDSVGDITIASAPADSGVSYFARVVALNPLGEGEARPA